RLPLLLIKWHTIGNLDVCSLTVEVAGAHHIVMVNVGKFCDEFRSSGRIYEMSGGGPLSIRNVRGCRWHLIAVHRSAKLQPSRKQRAREDVEHHSAVVVDVAGVSSPADRISAAVSHPDSVVQSHRSRRNSAFRKSADEVHRNQTSAELDHVRTADGRLQPCAVVELSVPVV